MYVDEPGGGSFEVGRVDELETMMTLDALMGCRNSADDVDLELRCVTMRATKEVVLRNFLDRGSGRRHDRPLVKC